MAEEETVSWDTPLGSGLLDDFEFTVTEASFRTDERYNGGQSTFLEWLGTTDSLDTPETHIWFTTGAFESIDGGATIVAEDRKPKMPVKTSRYGRLIDTCINVFDIKELLIQRGGPLESKTWVGTKWHIIREDPVQIKGVEMDPGKAGKEFPDAFLGLADNGAGTVAQSAPQSAPAAAPVNPILAAKQAAEAAAGAPKPLRDQVVDLIAQHKAAGSPFVAFQADVLDKVPGVDADTALLTELAEESGLWSTVNA